MRFKGSVLLAAGVALAASMISNAAAPKKPLSRVMSDTETPRSGAASQSTVSPKSGMPGKPVPASTDPVPDSPNTVLTANGLAVMETIFSYCGQADLSNATAYQAILTGATSGHGSAEIGALRSDPDYLNQKGKLNALLASVPPGTAISACQSSIATARRPLGVTSPIRTPGMGSAH